MNHLNDRAARVLDEVAACIVPELAAADPATRALLREVIDEALSERAPGVRRQFATFLSLLHLLPLLRWGSSFEGLDAARRRRYLLWLQDRAPSLLRKGFWGLKTLVFMGYYSQAAVAPSISYTPSFAGNEKLHA